MGPGINPLKSPVGAHVLKTTYGPLIDTALFLIILMRDPSLGQLGGGLALKISTFLGPNGTHLMARCHFTGPKKDLISRDQHPPTCPHQKH